MIQPNDDGAEAIRAWLVQTVATVTGVRPDLIDTSAPFHDFGVTSTVAISIAGQLEELLGRTLMPTLLYENPCIDALVRTIVGSDSDQPAMELDDGRTAQGRDNDVSVIGLACRFPGDADTPERFWRNLVEGMDGIRPVPDGRWNEENWYDPDPNRGDTSYVEVGGFLSDVAGFDAAFFGIPPGEALRMDPQHRVLLEVTRSAIEDAGIAPGALRGSRTGVFVGISGGQEYARLQTDRDGESCLRDPFFGYGSATSVAAGRVSYLLDLVGPSICFDTACSSSLLAVHQAVQSLRSGECDLAIVAGVSVLSHPAIMVQGCRAHMLARDGRCKTFDAGADGFGIGEGSGAVILERVPDSLRHARRVHAVVRGSAVNSDGRSNGMTAPSKSAQVSVIRQALRVAGVEPSEISFVEAHGSGTLLGDGVEISSLAEVFGADRELQPALVVGAVKTNIGHLLAAAGIAGFIKAVLSVRQSVIPPNLHLKQISSSISQSSRVVSLPDRPVQFPAGSDARRLAGVSSFGWSGTNVHVVLESAPDGAPATSGRPWQLVSLSTRTGSALEVAAGRLADHLNDHPDLDLAEVAATLHVGRDSFEHRRALVCRDLPDALSALAGVPGAGIPTAPATETIFLFPGTGDHHPGMGHDLYESLPAYRAAIDECADHLRPQLGLDIRQYLSRRHSAPSGSGIFDAMRGPAGGHQPAGASATDDELAVQHAAVFTVEYAVASLLRACGIHPAATIGYSLGEFAAACISGIFSPADAAMLVVRRARLIASGPPGAMIAVALGEADLPSLPPEASVAALCGPGMTVLAGPVEVMKSVAEHLGRRRVAHRWVSSAHAMHTPALEPIGPAISDLVASVHRRAPVVPFVSSLTGDRITDQQAQDPDYWATQIYRPVQFGAALKTVAAQRNATWVEVGPGQTLTGIAQQVLTAEGRSDVLLLPTLSTPVVSDSGRQGVLTAVGRYWAAGGTVDFSALYDQWPPRPVSLPGHPFEHQRFWPGPDAGPPRGKDRPAVGLEQTAERRSDVGDWCYVPIWKQSPAPSRHCTAGDVDLVDERWLVLSDGSVLTDALVRRLRDNGSEVVTVSATGVARPGDGTFVVDPVRADDMDRLVARLVEQDRLPTAVLHAWSLPPLPDAAPDDRLRIAQECGVLGILDLVRSLAQRAPGHPVVVSALTSGLLAVVGDDDVDPEKGALLGLCGTLERELPGGGFRCIDVTTADARSADPAATVDLVAREMSMAGADDRVAFRGGRRWVQDFQQLRLDAAGAGSQTWRPDGVYLITGGLGDVGLSLARGIAERQRVRLALIGRTVLPPYNTWSTPELFDDQVQHRIRAVQDLERLGAQVLQVAADVADPVQMSAAIATVRAAYGGIHGVIHAAGLPASGLIQLSTRADVERVLRPKVAGTLTLQQVLADHDLDFIVLCSSALVTLGGVGEVDYCAANAFLDTFAQHQRARGVPMTAINWGPWRTDAWHRGTHLGLDDLRARHGITADQGWEVLTRVLGSGLPQVLAVPFDLDVMRDQWARVTSELAGVGSGDRAYPRPQLRTAYAPARTQLEREICDIWGRHLGIDQVGINDQLFELGGNSLIGLTIIGEVARHTGVVLTAADLFDSPTPGGMAALVTHGRDAAVSPEPARRGQRRRQLADAASIRHSRIATRGAP